MDIQGKKLMVIGGAGLIGSHIVDRLCKEEVAQIKVMDNFRRGKHENLAQAVKDPRVTVVEGSITDKDLLLREMAGMDGVFLLAALWLGECVEDPRAAVDVNVVGTYNVIEAVKELGIQRVVYSSSASVYGNALVTPMTEEHPFNNRTMYGATKIAGEQFFRAFNDMYQLPYIGYRYMNVYGSRMDYQGVYVTIIMKVIDWLARGQRPVIFGDGSQSYDFIHVSDVARANILGMQADVVDEFFNIGTGIKTSLNELVDMLLELTGSELTPEYRPQERSFVTHRVGSTEKAEKLLGFKAQIPLIDGLREVLQWRIDNGMPLKIVR